MIASHTLEASRTSTATYRSWEPPVFVVRADGTGLRQIAPRGGFPVWWPDGRRIGYLVSEAQGGQRIETRTIDTGAVEVLGIEYESLNALFDVDAANRIVTTDSTLLANEVWLLH